MGFHQTFRTQLVVALGFLVLFEGTGGASPQSDPDEAILAREARLDVILRLALARNPDVLESRERLKAGEAHAEGAGAFPDLELKSELWGVPLSAPVSFDRAQTIMIGLRQTFPALGTRAAKERVAIEEAGSEGETERARVRDVTTQVRRAYAEYYRADQEYHIHLEHVGLLSELVELARAHYQTGRGTQQDVLRLSVELSQLHADVADIEQQIRSARTLLNTLMARAADAPLGPTRELVPAEQPSGPGRNDVEATIEARRPELAAAARAVRRGEAALDLAERSAHWPSLMVGADYWYMPTFSDPHAYGAMVSINLPWLNPQHSAAVREAEHSVAADRRALESQRNVAAFEIRDAAAKVSAARQSFEILDISVLPDARRSFESARAAYESGQGDGLALLEAQRAYLNVSLQRSRALARLQMAVADYDRATGLSAPPPRRESGKGRQ